MKKLSKLLAAILVAVLIVTAFPLSSFALGTTMETAQEIKLDEVVEISAFENNGSKWLKFIPETDGYYAFYSFNNDIDACATLYDGEGVYLTEDDDGGEDLNFKISNKLYAGDTYYLYASQISDYTEGKYSVSVKKLVKAESVNIHKTKDIVVYKDMLYMLYPEFLPIDSAPERIETVTANEDFVSFWPSDSAVSFSANAAGKATITITTENGLTDTVNITAVEPEEISLESQKDFRIDTTYISHAFSFIPKEDGVYKISVEEQSEDIYCFTDIWDIENFNQISYESGYDFYFTAELKAGKEYIINSKNNDGYTSASADLSLKVEKAVYPTSVKVIVPDYDIHKNESFNLEYSFEPANTNITNVGVSIDNYDVLEYNGGSSFYALEEGKATITVTVENGVTATAEIEVKPYKELYLDSTETVKFENGSYDKCFSFVPKESGEYCFDFVSNEYFDNYYAIQDNNGNELVATGEFTKELFTFLEAGERYTIVLRSYGYEGIEVTLNISKAVSAEYFEILLPDVFECYSDYYITMETSFAPEGCSEAVTWSTTNENVASLCMNGDIIAGHVGTAIVTGTTPNGLSDSITIVVKEAPSIEVNKEYQVNIDEEYENVYFEFTPEKSGYYYFEIISQDSVWVNLFKDNYGHIAGVADSFKGYFSADETYEIAMCMNYVSTGSFSFNVSECGGVKSVEILTLPEQLEYIEGYEDFRYSGLTAKVTLEDGTTEIYDYNNDETVLGYIVSISHNYDENDVYHSTDVSVGNAFDSFSFIIKENNIASIECLTESLEIIEKTNGSYTYNDAGERFFYYNYSIDDIMVKINYNDDESIVVPLGSTVDGYYVNWNDNQHSTPWTLGNEDNYIKIDYLDNEVFLPVNIIESPIEKIVLNSAPSRVYYKYDPDYGLNYSDGSYDLTAYDFTGISFTAYYKDGSVKTYTDKDIDDNNFIGDYEFMVDYDWTSDTGIVEVTASYIGAEFTYDIVYKEFPYEVKDIKVISLPEKTEYTQRYYPDFIGLTFEITYTDGSTKTVEITEENAVHDMDYRSLSVTTKVKVDGFDAVIEENYSSEVPFVISYGGVKCGISGFNYLPLDKKLLVKANTKGSSIEFTLTYSDGTIEILTIEDIANINDNGIYVGYIETTKGLLPYHILVEYDKTQNIKVFDIFILDRVAILEVKGGIVSGDVNGDGIVNVADVAQLKKYIAGLLSETESENLNCDVDENSIINVGDLAQLKKMVAGLI